jgi:prepilin-type N-terminal cleavage/methylation domain-containing protein
MGVISQSSVEIQSKTVMKLGYSKRRNDAMTLTEVLVVLFVVAVLIMIILPVLAAGKKKSSKVGCPNNLKQIALAFRIWEGDNNDKYPTQVSMKEGGAMELVVTGNVAAVFQVMSNELFITKVLICPADARRHWATNFTADFGNKNVSYFVGLDAADSYPESILSGDDNFEINKVAVKSGVLELSKNTPLAWTSERHRFTGCIGFADGSVQATTDSGLTDTIINQYKFSSDFTNRFRIAIP